MEGDIKGEEKRQNEEGATEEVEFTTTQRLLGCGVEGESIEISSLGFPDGKGRCLLKTRGREKKNKIMKEYKLLADKNEQGSSRGGLDEC